MIRELRLEDLEFVNNLLSEFNYKITENSLNNPFFKSLVYDENEIRGVIVYNLIYDRIEIEYIIVSNQYKGKGIGTKLLKMLEKENVTNITLEVRESNKVAINFYKKNGYKIEAIRKNYYENENGYLMIKELGE